MRRFFAGFGYAAQGFWAAVKEERNLRFHLCAGAYVLLASLFYPLARWNTPCCFSASAA